MAYPNPMYPNSMQNPNGPQYDVSRFNNSGMLGGTRNPLAPQATPPGMPPGTSPMMAPPGTSAPQQQPMMAPNRPMVGGAQPGNSLQSNPGQRVTAIAELFARLFGGDPGKAYQDAANEYNQRAQKGYDYLDPYNKAGQNELGNYEQQLALMRDPQAFVNHILSGYSLSPGAQMEEKQGQTAMQNAASASGMLGSGDLLKNAADYAQQLSSKDMQQYLTNILGVNKDLLSGYSDISHIGYGAGSQEAQMAQQQAEENEKAKYAEENAQQQNKYGEWGDIANFIKSYL